MRSIAWALASALLSIATVAVAHPHAYVGANDFVCVSETEDSDGLPDVGCVRFAVGEPTPDPTGTRTSFIIVDSVTNAVGGFFCQDLNADSICGDDGTIGGVVEPAESFCGSLETIQWDQTLEVIIFIDGPLFGNPATSGDGCVFGTAGTVEHL